MTDEQKQAIKVLNRVREKLTDDDNSQTGAGGGGNNNPPSGELEG